MHVRNIQFLIIKANHLLGDIMSIYSWVICQLDFIHGSNGFKVKPGPLFLKDFFTKKYPHCHGGRLPAQLLSRSRKKISSQRNYHYFHLKLIDLKRSSYNDFFIHCLFQTIRQLRPQNKRTTIWLPVHIRKKRDQGFGNGITRIRIHDQFHQNTQSSLLNIRKQKRDSLKNGEIIPIPLYKKINTIEKFLIRCYINRPWPTMALLFSAILMSPKTLLILTLIFPRLLVLAIFMKNIHSLSISTLQNTMKSL